MFLNFGILLFAPFRRSPTFRLLQFVRIFEAFRDDTGYEFKYLHVFTRIERC